MYYYFQILLNMLDFSLKYTTCFKYTREFSESTIRIYVSESTNIATFSECYLQCNFLFLYRAFIHVIEDEMLEPERDREAKEGGETKRDHACAISSIRFLRDDVFPCLWTGARGHWTFALIIPMAFHTTFPMHSAYSRLEQWQRIVDVGFYTCIRIW